MSDGFGVAIDLAVCEGYANCVMAAPTVFDIDEKSGLAVLLQSRPPADARPAAEEAVRNCPTGAISLRD